jgi:hypothetical protein|tara:strand:- start:162 stop:1472 length:1311 start_codon:yes stop_codon:yes gene_type:complete
MKNSYWILILIVTACFSKFLIPLNTMDTGWDFGHAFSSVRGESNLLYNSYLGTSADYLYGLLIKPLAYITSSVYTPKIFYSILLAALALLLLIRKNRMGLTVGIISLVLSNYIVLSHRPEIFTILIGLLAYPYLFINDKINWKVAIPLGLILFFIHPSNAVLMGAAALASKELLIRRENSYLLVYAIFIGVLGGLLAFSSHIHHLEILRSRIFSSNHLSSIFTFLKYSGISLAALIIAKRKVFTLQFGLNFVVLALLCIILGPYYYFIFLLIPFIVHPTFSRDKFTNIAVIGAITFNVFTTIIHPYIVYIENPAYAEKAGIISETIEELSVNAPKGNVFIDQHIGLPLYAKSDRAKMILKVDNESYFIVIKPESGDIAYFTSKQDAELFSREIARSYNLKTTNAITLEEPTKGKLTLQSRYRKRTDSLGLWQTTIL